MTSAFFGLDIIRRALAAQKLALDVTAHNIANANTPGFSRQEAVQATTPPYTIPALNRPAAPGQLGTGVQIAQIRRLRDQFIDAQIRQEGQSAAKWKAIRDALSQVEVIFNEPSDQGLSMVFSRFWNAWQEVARAPETIAVRASLREQAVTLAGAIRHTYEQLKQLRDQVDYSVSIKVDQINTLARQIFDLNRQISNIEAMGDQANDLRDQRDLLMEELTKIADVTLSETSTGKLLVFLQGRPLVGEVKVAELAAVPDPMNGNLRAVQWADTGQPVAFNNGEIAALLEIRDMTIPAYQRELDAIAQALMTNVNAQHRAGFDLNGASGGDFFVGAGASDIDVDASIKGDLTRIAASASGAPGDGRNALSIAQLQFAKVLNGGTATIDDVYRGLISQLGVSAQEAKRLQENQDLLVEQLTLRREAISGVNIDEEVTNMIRYQHAFEAASRLARAYDEILDTLINELGR
ncbi:MAG: flagellar hook-associated protein FlgK [Armatimonadota bacterium]|nr:flagellar hook-associated protein FlgK [Armatimonadota bacterium]